MTNYDYPKHFFTQSNATHAFKIKRLKKKLKTYKEYKVDMHDVETIRNRVSAFSWVHLIYFNQ